MQSISDSQYEALRSQAMVIIEEHAEKVKKAISTRAATRLKNKIVLSRDIFEVNSDDWKPMIKCLLDAYSFASILAQVKYSRKEKRADFTKEVILRKADICGLDDQFKYLLCKDLGFDCEKPISMLKEKYESVKSNFNYTKRCMEHHAKLLRDPDLPEGLHSFHTYRYSKCKEQFERAEKRACQAVYGSL